MDLRCHHHPDRQAVGTCCYCNRPMCEECLSTNRQGRSFCSREDECLACQDEPSSPGEPTSPIVGYLIDESSLEAQVTRVSEALEELGELKGLLDELGGKAGPDEPPPGGPSGPAQGFEADHRIAGFCACRIAEGAVAMTSLISLRVDFLRSERGLAESPELFEKANAVKGFIEQEAEPKIREHMDWAGPYGNLDVAGLLAGMEGKGCREIQ